MRIIGGTKTVLINGSGVDVEWYYASQPGRSRFLAYSSFNLG